MPFMRIRDSRGMEYQMRTQIPELMALWFLETVHKLDIGHASWNQIMIEPDYTYDDKGNSIPDWPTDYRQWDQIPNGLTPKRRGEWFVERMKFHFDTFYKDDDMKIPEITRD